MYKRRNKYWYSDFSDINGRRYRISLNTTNEEEARLKEKELRAKVVKVRPGKNETLLWIEYKKWFSNYLKINKSAGTIYWNGLALRYFEEFYKPVWLRDITPDVLMRFKGFLTEKAAQNKGKPGPAGRNRAIREIKTMMHTAEKYGKIGIKQNWEIVEKDKNENDGKVVFHTIEELKFIGQALKDEGDLLTCFFLGYEEGLRRGEIAFLYKTDYNAFTHTITVSKKPDWLPKTKKSARTIPLLPNTEAAIKASIERTPESKYLINLAGKREKSNFISSTYRYTVKKKCPFIKSFMHKLRHTYGTMLIQRGVHIKIVSDLMGHSNIAQTEKYIHLGQSEYVEAVKALPNINF